MKNIYNLFRIASRIRSQRLKLLGIYFLHMTRQRYLGVFIDPILAVISDVVCVISVMGKKEKH